MDYESLRPYCQTTRQEEIIDALVSTKSQRRAAKKLNIAKGTIDDHLQKIRSNLEI